MKANLSLRQIVLALVTGGALLITTLPALAGDRDHRRYDHRHEHRYDKRDHGKYERRHDDRRHHGYGHRHDHRGKSTVVYRYYHPRVIHYSPPPRVVYRYEPGVVVHVPPIVFRVN